MEQAALGYRPRRAAMAATLPLCHLPLTAVAVAAAVLPLTVPLVVLAAVVAGTPTLMREVLAGLRLLVRVTLEGQAKITRTSAAAVQAVVQAALAKMAGLTALTMVATVVQVVQGITAFLLRLVSMRAAVVEPRKPPSLRLRRAARAEVALVASVTRGPLGCPIRAAAAVVLLLVQAGQAVAVPRALSSSDTRWPHNG